VNEKPNHLKGVDTDPLTFNSQTTGRSDNRRPSLQLFSVHSLGQAVKAKEPLPPSGPLSRIVPANPPAETINIVVEVENIGEWERVSVPISTSHSLFASICHPSPLTCTQLSQCFRLVPSDPVFSTISFRPHSPNSPKIRLPRSVFPATTGHYNENWLKESWTTALHPT